MYHISDQLVKQIQLKANQWEIQTPSFPSSRPDERSRRAFLSAIRLRQYRPNPDRYAFLHHGDETPQPGRFLEVQPCAINVRSQGADISEHYWK